jgi:hypothetical protein
MAHLVSGIKGAQNNAIVERAPNGGLDAGALLDSISQDQGGDQAKNNANAGSIGGDLANQIAGGGSPSLDQIIGGLGAQNPADAKNQSTTPEQGAVTEKETPKEESKGSAQSGSENGLVIEVEQTTIKAANGQEIKTEIVKEVGQAPAAATSANTPIESIPAEVRSTPPLAPIPEMPAKGEPTTAPAPPAESLKEAMNTTAVAEAAKPTPEAHITQSLVETLSVTVRTEVMLMRCVLIQFVEVRRRG